MLMNFWYPSYFPIPIIHDPLLNYDTLVGHDIISPAEGWWPSATCCQGLFASHSRWRLQSPSKSPILGSSRCSDAPDWVSKASRWSQFVAPVTENSEQVEYPWYLDNNPIKTAVSTKTTQPGVFLTLLMFLMGSGWSQFVALAMSNDLKSHLLRPKWHSYWAPLHALSTHNSGLANRPQLQLNNARGPIG